jgi:hypothetical protein
MTDQPEQSAVVESTNAELLYAECRKHGRLPRSAFYACDLRRKQRCCRECHKLRNKLYRDRHPLRRLWQRFVRRVKRRWPHQSQGLTWRSHGSTTIAKAFVRSRMHKPPKWTPNQVANYLEARYSLAWHPKATEIDLNQLVLLDKQLVQYLSRKRSDAGGKVL